MSPVMQPMRDISVIICTYSDKRWDGLVAAVESVQQQTLPPREIIIVIDHNPLLLEKVQEQIPGVVAIGNAEPQGLSGARNSGIAVARSQLIAFLDDDAIATADWLMLLCKAFTDPRVLGAGGAVIPHWLEQKPGWLPEEFYWVVGCTYRGLPQAAGPIRNPIGANMAFRRELFTSVGGFRSGIGRVGARPLGCEETELCIRAHQYWSQAIFLYQPQASVSHCVPGNRISWRYFFSRCYAEGLSKAVVSRYVGVKDSLASERNYILRTLSRGIAVNLSDALLNRNLAGLARAGAIMAGLLVTSAGYIVGRVLSLLRHDSTMQKSP